MDDVEIGVDTFRDCGVGRADRDVNGDELGVRESFEFEDAGPLFRGEATPCFR